MSWLRIEGRMPHHRKVAPLSDTAFRLHVTAMAWCVEEQSDGRVPTNIPSTLPAAPRGKQLEAAIKELTGSGLWLEDGGAFAIHDFLVYNPSAAQAAALAERRIAAGKLGGKRSAEVKQTAKQVLEQAPKQSPSKTQPKLNPDPDPDPDPRSEIPPPPSVVPPQGGDRDIAHGDLNSFAPDPPKPKARERKPKQPQWRRFPPDFEPDESHRNLAQQLGLNLAQQLLEIRDHEYKSPRSDAAAALRTWLRNAPKFGAPTLGAARAHRPDPRNEAQDRNADHDAREALAASRKVREMLALADQMKAGANVR